MKQVTNASVDHDREKHSACLSKQKQVDFFSRSNKLVIDPIFRQVLFIFCEANVQQFTTTPWLPRDYSQNLKVCPTEKQIESFITALSKKKHRRVSRSCSMWKKATRLHKAVRRTSKILESNIYMSTKHALKRFAKTVSHEDIDNRDWGMFYVMC